MNILRKLLGAKPPPQTQTVSKGKQYALSSLGFPREKTSLEERLARQRKETADPALPLGSIMTINWQDLARGQLPNSPLLVALRGRAQAIVRLDNMPRNEAQEMKDAVEQGRVLLVPVLALCPTLPILGPRFVVFDSPASPFTVEDPRDIRLADVQEFVSTILDKGEGDIHLYWGSNAEPVASGVFSLCMNPRKVRWPYKSTDADREAFWQLLNGAAKHLKRIPVNRRDFDAAVKFYFEKTAL